MRRGALIIGSCVSRDALSHLAPEVAVVGYLARQSLLSAESPVPPELLHAERIPSRFQRRSLESDLAGNLFDEVRAHARLADMVLWDIVDERNGVYSTTAGRRFTNNWELHQTGAIDDIEQFELLEFGTAEHAALWRPRADALVALLRELDLWERTILVMPPMADRFDDGGAVSAVAARFPDDYDSRFAPYVAHLSDHPGARVVRPLASEVRASRSHRWGAAPFHYADATEARIAEAVRAIAHDAEWPATADLPVRWSVTIPAAGRVELAAELTGPAEASGFLVHALALDRAGAPLPHEVLRWPYSRHVGGSYCYIPASARGGVVALAALEASPDVARIELDVRNWKNQTTPAASLVSRLLQRDGASWRTLDRRRQARPHGDASL